MLESAYAQYHQYNQSKILEPSHTHIHLPPEITVDDFLGLWGDPFWDPPSASPPEPAPVALPRPAPRGTPLGPAIGTRRQRQK